MFLQPDNLTLWDDARSDLPYVLCLVFGGLDLCCFLLMCFDKWCSKEGRDPFANLMWLMDLRATQRGSSKRDDDAPGSSAVRSDQAAVLGGVLRSGPWKDLQAPQNYAGPHQAIFHVSNMFAVFSVWFLWSLDANLRSKRRLCKGLMNCGDSAAAALISINKGSSLFGSVYTGYVYSD